MDRHPALLYVKLADLQAQFHEFDFVVREGG